MDFTRQIKLHVLTLLTAVVSAGFLTSCIEPMFDSEGDCDVTHIIRFRYDRNLKWADAFPSEVKSVNLYAFDSKGRFVKQYTGAGDELSQPGYSIVLDLPADSYRFVAWCGLQNAGAAEESFTVGEPVPGVTTIDELCCSLNTRSTASSARYSDSQLHFLYHGYLETVLEDNHDGREYVHTIELTKDTNHIRIILQELSSDEDMKPADYSFHIEAANGRMEYNNDVEVTDVVTYGTWSLMSDEVGIGKIDVENGTVKFVKGVIADLSLSRLMADQRRDVMLTIVNESSEEKSVIARVPLIQYALLSKEYYESAYGHKMTDQEFLDREDEYVMTFFLSGDRWLDSYIDIHQWRVVLHDYNLTR